MKRQRAEISSNVISHIKSAHPIEMWRSNKLGIKEKVSRGDFPRLIFSCPVPSGLPHRSHCVPMNMNPSISGAVVRDGRLELPTSCSQTFEQKFFYFFRCFIAVFVLLWTIFATLTSTASAHSTAVCSQTCGQKPLSEHPRDRGQKAVL